MIKKIFLFFISIWVLSIGISVRAEVGECKKTIETEITEDLKRFSLISKGQKTASAFTDIGCALIWRKTLCASETVDFDENSIVYDYLSGEPVPFEKAFYVVGSNVKTPSGYGIIAFKDKSSANKFAKKEGGKVVKFYEISILEIK